MGVNSLRLYLYAWLIELGIIPVISTQFEEGDQIISPRSNSTGHEILVKMGVNSLRLHLYAWLIDQVAILCPGRHTNVISVNLHPI